MGISKYNVYLFKYKKNAFIGDPTLKITETRNTAVAPNPHVTTKAALRLNCNGSRNKNKCCHFSEKSICRFSKKMSLI